MLLNNYISFLPLDGPALVANLALYTEILHAHVQAKSNHVVVFPFLNPSIFAKTAPSHNQERNTQVLHSQSHV